MTIISGNLTLLCLKSVLCSQVLFLLKWIKVSLLKLPMWKGLVSVWFWNRLSSRLLFPHLIMCHGELRVCRFFIYAACERPHQVISLISFSFLEGCIFPSVSGKMFLSVKSLIYVLLSCFLGAAAHPEPSLPLQLWEGGRWAAAWTAQPWRRQSRKHHQRLHH